ncbi:mercuric transporter MerT family protein [Bradyrhizobium sp. I1.14.4]|uniref:mercuric transporter MerT family protein n=1 Tax=unclassified Bradyrhizobium TaxID=2631580 RepID=UPI003D1CB3EF
MMVKEDEISTQSSRGSALLATGGLVAALAASSCCIVPVLLFSLGISGAWIGSLTRLAPYQPYFIAATIAFLGGGYWLTYRASKITCAEGAACARRLPSRLVKTTLVVATLLVVAAFGFDFLAPLLFDT